MKPGWQNESERHDLARQGIKTNAPQESKPIGLGIRQKKRIAQTLSEFHTDEHLGAEYYLSFSNELLFMSTRIRDETDKETLTGMAGVFKQLAKDETEHKAKVEMMMRHMGMEVPTNTGY
jgi:hypothetical protein